MVKNNLAHGVTSICLSMLDKAMKESGFMFTVDFVFFINSIVILNLTLY